MYDKLLKVALPLLLALAGATLHFVMETNARLAVIEWRMNYSLGEAPWKR